MWHILCHIVQGWEHVHFESVGRRFEPDGAKRCLRRSSLKERAVSRPWFPQIWAVFDRGAHVEIGVGVKARAEPDRVAAGGP